jgi:hypothetical protein
MANEYILHPMTPYIIQPCQVIGKAEYDIVVRENNELKSTISILNNQLKNHIELINTHYTEINELREENRNLRSIIGELKKTNEDILSGLRGRDIAKKVETIALHLLFHKYKTCKLSSLVEVLEFLEKLCENTLSQKKRDIWNKNVNPEQQAKIIEYYKENMDELDDVRFSVSLLKADGNNIAHIDIKDINKEEVLKSFENNENMEHVVYCFNYIKRYDHPI